MTPKSSRFSPHVFWSRFLVGWPAEGKITIADGRTLTPESDFHPPLNLARGPGQFHDRKITAADPQVTARFTYRSDFSRSRRSLTPQGYL